MFVNPPYSDVCEWMGKCLHESRKNGTTVVALVPARMSTRWFHKFVAGKAELRFIKGRLRFCGAIHAAPFDGMVVVFGRSGYTTIERG